MTLVHILAGLLAIVAGFAALFAPKGGPLHRKGGMVFVFAMLVMTGLGGLMAAMQFHIALQRMNVIAATLTFYLVVTALLTVRRRDPDARWIDAATMVIATAVGLLAIFIGVDAMGRSKSPLFPLVPALVFGTVALLAAFGDMRLALGRSLDPPHRIARHLWRMCFAMFIATGSFFLGQAKVFPEELRVLPVLAAPVVLVLVTMLFWWIRVLVTKRVPGPTSRRRRREGSAPARGLVAE